MAVFNVKVEDEVLKISADKKEDLPEIVDTIIKHRFEQADIRTRQAGEDPRDVTVPGKPITAGRTELEKAREFFRPGRKRLEEFLTPKELENRDKLIEASKPTRLIGQIGLGLFSGLTAGLQRAIPKELRKEQEVRSVREGIARTTAEIGGFIVGPGKIFRGIRSGVAASQALGRVISSQGLRKVIGSVLAGGVIGALEAPEDAKKFLDAPTRLQRATGVGLVTGAIESAFQVGKVAIRPFRALAQLRKKTNITEIDDLIKLKNTNLSRNATVALRETQDSIDDNVNILRKQIVKEANQGSLKFKGLLPKWFRSNSKLYGQKLDKASEALAKTPEGVALKGQMNELLNKTLFESNAAELPQDSKGFKVIQKLIEEKYGTTQFSKTFQLSEVFNDIKRLRSSGLPSGVKKGLARFSEDEVIIGILNKNWGEFVGSKIPAMANLNRSYKPVIELMKQATKTFKPFTADFDNKTGADFLIRLGKGSLKGGERKFLNLLQSGTSFGKGAGQVTRRLGALGTRLEQFTETQTQSRKLVADEILKSSREIERLPTFLRDNFEKRIANIKLQFKPDIDALEAERLIIEELQKNSGIAKTLLKIIGFAGGAEAARRFIVAPGIRKIVGQAD